eukprot:TRINITY_DN4181_c1_g4_i2.p1 TRINITY_DN4181_c1_g4~~TRINITY_DN4181_c1_g4_i2.p1  ORF type:complete len:188 (-),score=35.86 TRINITY_DN4181_c1_g4_i2:31-594(-)
MLSEDEARLYDRQIRLWGVDAQQRMKQARVLVIGLRGVTSEVCKNLVLAGVQHVTLLEPGTVEPVHLAAHLFVSAADIGSNRASACVPGLAALNPLVEVRAQAPDLRADTLDATFIGQFGVVVAAHQSLAVLVRLDALCRQQVRHRAGGPQPPLLRVSGALLLLQALRTHRTMHSPSELRMACRPSS